LDNEEIVKSAIKKPDMFVLKPQREGIGIFSLLLRDPVGLHGAVLDEWCDLQEALQAVEIDGRGNDVVKWVLDKSRNFSTKPFI
jgi:hypothetical protein